ncbi:MAG: HIT family protein [Gammaproteobacteria bacterium]|nr:HIT family protein [Gammaproteobacteria bacterium]
METGKVDGFELDSRLEQDCHLLCEVDQILVLLMDNALVPWFILVPRVEVEELYELTPERRASLDALIDRLSDFITTEFQVDKLNVAAIGNIVRQLHVHLVGRSEGDYCWPGVVWGRSERKTYTQDQVTAIAGKIKRFLNLP